MSRGPAGKVSSQATPMNRIEKCVIPREYSLPARTHSDRSGKLLLREELIYSLTI